MKMLFFKFHQNRTMNEEFELWEGQILSGGLEGGRGKRLQKFEKCSYRMVVPFHTENVSILAQLESD